MSVVLAGEDESVKFRVLADPESGWALGVRQYRGHDDRTRFDEFRDPDNIRLEFWLPAG